MSKLSITFAHFRTFRWTAIAVHFFKKYQWPFDWELIVVDNSPDHPSIKVLTETSLGEGIKIVNGERDFSSHGRANEIALHHATGDLLLFSESDAFPIRDNWANEYIKALADHDLIGPEIPQSSGPYIHPAGSLYRRSVFDSMKEWQDSISDWVFCSDAAIELGTSDKPFHVVAHRDFLASKDLSEGLKAKIELWKRAEFMQEMRSFQDDSFETYQKRGIPARWQPEEGRQFYNTIGWEAGQMASNFAQAHGFRCLKAPTTLKWLPGHEGGQAAYSDVFGGFRHCWCGTSSFSPAIAQDVREYKMNQMNLHFAMLPKDLQKQVIELEKQHA